MQQCGFKGASILEDLHFNFLVYIFLHFGCPPSNISDFCNKKLVARKS